MAFEVTGAFLWTIDTGAMGPRVRGDDTECVAPYRLFAHALEYAARSFGPRPAAMPSSRHSWMRRLNDFCRTRGVFRCDVGVSPICGIFGIAMLGGGGGGGGGGRKFGSGAVGSCASAGSAPESDATRTAASRPASVALLFAIAEFRAELLTLRRPAGPSRRARP